MRMYIYYEPLGLNMADKIRTIYEVRLTAMSEQDLLILLDDIKWELDCRSVNQ